MPLPKPRKNEDKKIFINRCVSDKIMNKEFNNKEQRFAVCYSIWDKEIIDKLTRKIKKANLS